MSNKANRAAQFLPFDSLKGLQEELRAREEMLLRVEKREIGEDAQNALSEELLKADRGNIVEVTFYLNGHYVTVTNKLTDKNEAYQFIVVGEVKIYFGDIYEMKTIKR